MDPLTAAWTDSQFAQFGIPSGTFSSLNLLTCPPHWKAKGHPHQRELRKETENSDKYPLILFSPGLGNPRLYYSALAQEVASRGYVVVSIDHPYDAGIVVFPDNATILAANITTDEQITFDLSVRVKDVSFILDQLSNPKVAQSLIPDLEDECEIDVDKVGIFGHSLGGATTASTMLSDRRLIAGINLDGTFFGPLASPSSTVTISEPFLIFTHEGKNISTDASWASIWPKLRGWKRLLELQGSAHGTFTDLPDVVDVLGLSGKLPAEVGELLGSIDGGRAMEVIGTYVSAFFDFVLKGSGEGLLDGRSERFPEVVFEEPEV